MARIMGGRKGVDPLVPAAQLAAGRYSPTMLEWIDSLLGLDADARPASVEQSLGALLGLAVTGTVAARPARTAAVAADNRFDVVRADPAEALAFGEEPGVRRKPAVDGREA